MLPFGEDRWQDLIYEEDLHNEEYPEDFDGNEKFALDGSYRFVTYDLRDKPVTDDAYRGLIDTIHDEGSTVEEVGFEAGEILGRTILGATEKSFSQWTDQSFDEPNPGRDLEYEKHGTPYIRIQDSFEGEDTTEIATQPLNAIGYLKNRYESREEFDPSENFLKGLDKVLFNAAYRE